MIDKIVKYMRKEAGLEQKELAEKIGFASSTISGYEIGLKDPKYSTVEKIAEACEFEIVFIDKNSGQPIDPEELKKIKKGR